MADKLLEIAKEKKAEKSEPRIAFNVGRGHSGIEDFLILGQDACRNIITSFYSPAFVRKAIDSNHGPQKFSSARLLKLPSNFNPDALEQTLTEDFKLVTPNLGVQDRIVTDTKLMQGLQKTSARPK